VASPRYSPPTDPSPRKCWLHHRGPDGRGHWLSPDRQVGLGHTRLSIIDLSTGAQPITNEDESVWIVANGEFCDFERIQVALRNKGHRLRTGSNSEIALHLYEDLGPGCLHPAPNSPPSSAPSDSSPRSGPPLTSSKPPRRARLDGPDEEGRGREVRPIVMMRWRGPRSIVGDVILWTSTRRAYDMGMPELARWTRAQVLALPSMPASWSDGALGMHGPRCSTPPSPGSRSPAGRPSTSTWHPVSAR
jgi:hypothetical protein